MEVILKVKPNCFLEEDSYLGEFERHCKGSNFSGASGGLWAIILSGLFKDKCCDSLVHLLIKLWIYDSLPYFLSVLALL